MVGPTAGSYITKPFSPNSGNAAVTNTTPGYGSYNGYDCGLNNVHTLGMTVPCKSETWFTVTQSLATYAGQTITFRARSFNDTADPSWYQLDDVEWAVVAATLGTAQGFGVNITAPATGATFVPGQIVPITASVDANPTAATTPVTARLFDSAGAAISTPFTLFNDGTHGDAAAGDGIWTNNGSIVADAVTVPLSATTGAGYVLRVFGRDGSTSTISAQNGLIRGPGTGAAAETQANYWNIDEQSFNVQTAAVTLTKTSAAVSDPVNGGTNAKAIPGATVRYCLLVANAGPQSASNIIMTDAVPASTSYIAGSMRSGTTCASAATVEDDNNVGADESDPVGSSFSAGTVITITTAVANGGTVALTFDVLIN